MPETLWRYIIGACGIIVLAAGVIFAFVGMRISPRKSLDAKSLGISIDYPGDGDHVTVPCKISGRSKGPPRGAKLWLFTISGYGRGIRYWPQDGIEVKNGTWRTELRATRFSAGDKRSFAIFLVGEDGQALIHHFKVAGKSINDLGSKGSGLPWPGIEALTSDMSQATETREVTLTSR